MHVILTGATGLVGTAVLSSMLTFPTITKISILSRRSVPMLSAHPDPRVETILLSDFSNYPSDVLSKLQGAEACVWALGISQSKVSSEQYPIITRDYALTAARAFSKMQVPAKEKEGAFRFVYVSGEGATQTPGRFSAIFARVKGETEALLSEIPGLETISVRPCVVDATDHQEIEKWIPDPGMAYKVMGFFLTPLPKLAPKLVSPTRPLGEFLTRVATGGFAGKLQGEGVERLGSSYIVRNIAIRRFMGI